MHRKKQILKALENIAIWCAELGWTDRARRIDKMIAEIEGKEFSE